MKCELAQEKIALAVYGELPDEASPELDRHLAICDACRRELEAVQALHQAMYLYPVTEPSANLLARTRLRLEDALDTLPRQSWMVRLAQNMLAGAGRLRTAPVAASVLLLLGIGGGAFGGYHLAEKRAAANAAIVAASNEDLSSAQIANVSSIVREPDSETVEVSYDRVVPVKMRGSLDDPFIRSLLLAAAQANGDNEIRSNSVGLLAAECRAGHQCNGGPVRDALMVSARYDRSPAVRRKALAGLEPFIAEDMRVRDAVLEILMSDGDPAVRTQAISVLQPVEADSSVRQVLHTVAVEDQNPHIRNASQQVLSQLPEIQ
ncbi:MAG TPA: HEAT repeat domain-containing protein [Acidisarcina sp.]|nr:HEAT repeat domain-containing protein [Acidisarcina sp.]